MRCDERGGWWWTTMGCGADDVKRCCGSISKKIVITIGVARKAGTV